MRQIFRSRLKIPFGRRAAAIGVAGVALSRQIIGQYASFGRLGHADFVHAWATKRVLRRLLRRKHSGAVRLLALVLFLAGFLVVGSCSERQDQGALPSGPAAEIHPAGWLERAAKENFHGQVIQRRGWDMAGCQSCHGADYAGGIAASSCLKCHPDTPEGCNVCHGSQSNDAPPRDIQGNVAASFAGVGAHQTHVRQGSLARALDCAGCHLVPERLADPGHLDGDGQAELNWGSLARTGGAIPQFDPATLTCAGTYCHRGGKFGNNVAVIWNKVDSGQAACGTCHGLPPAATTGHPAVPEGVACLVCHRTVVDQDLAIADRSLHLNGTTEATCGTCHRLPPGEETGHPQVTTCSMCHKTVVDEGFNIINETLHNNGTVDLAF